MTVSRFQLRANGESVGKGWGLTGGAAIGGEGAG